MPVEKNAKLRTDGRLQILDFRHKKGKRTTALLIIHKKDGLSMTKYQLFNPEIEPCCAFCEHGRTAPDGKTVLCIKKGIVLPDGHCRKYRYDPLRREPKPRPKLPQYDKSEFEI